MENKKEAIKCEACGKFFNSEYGICPFCGSAPMATESIAKQTANEVNHQNLESQPQKETAKRCVKCQNIIDNADAKFCPLCGGNEFEKISNIQENVADSSEKSINLPQPVETKKSLKKWQIALIITAGIVLIIIISVLNTLNDYNEKQKLDDEFNAAFSDFADDLEDFVDEEKVEYTKGTFENNIYTNEWANIRLTVPEGYTEGNKVNYDSFSDDGTAECGLYLISPQNEMYAVNFMDASSQKYIDENIFLLQISAGITNMNVDNVEYTPPEKFEDIEIAGENYIVAHYTVKSFGVEFVQSCYVRKIEDRFCYITIINSTKEENDAMVKCIEAIN